MEALRKFVLVALPLCGLVVFSSPSTEAQTFSILEETVYNGLGCQPATQSQPHRRFSGKYEALSSGFVECPAFALNVVGSTHFLEGEMYIWDKSSTADIVCSMSINVIDGGYGNNDSQVTSGTGIQTLTFSTSYTPSGGDEIFYNFTCVSLDSTGKMEIISYATDEY